MLATNARAFLSPRPAASVLLDTAATSSLLHSGISPLLNTFSGTELEPRGPRSNAFNLAPSGAPTGIKLLKKDKRLELLYEGGRKLSLPAELLRVCSPSADTRRVHAATGRVRVVSGRRHVGIMSVEPVGNYAIRIHFDDLHHSGIFTWDYLAQLGGPGRWPAMRDYLRRLRQSGMSRDPPAAAVAVSGAVRRGATAGVSAGCGGGGDAVR